MNGVAVLMDRTSMQTSLPVSRYLRWCSVAWQLFRRAPVRLWLLALLPIVVEGVLQMVPHVGIVTSKLLTPLASAWVLLLVDRMHTLGMFAPRAASRVCGRRWRSLLLLALVSAGIFVLQSGVALAIGGPAQTWALIVGDADALHFTKPQFALVLTSGIPAAMLLAFAMPRVLLDGRRVAPGMRDSVSAALRHWRPMLVFGASCAALVGGLPWVPSLLLLMLPYSLCVGYAAYRDIFRHGDRGLIDGDAVHR